MTGNAIAVQTEAEIIEAVVVSGDLSKLTPAQRVAYHGSTCKSLGLNPLTRPFDYITLNSKLTLYAKKDATDQLRRLHGIGIGKPEIQFVDDLIIVSVSATNKDGRQDADVGIVKKGDMRGDVANAIMKAVTKAKRRVTLSICGLGWLDETEVETIKDASPVIVAETGEIVDEPPAPPQANGTHKVTPTEFWSLVKKAGFDRETGQKVLAECGGDFARAIEAVSKQIPPADVPF